MGTETDREQWKWERRWDKKREKEAWTFVWLIYMKKYVTKIDSGEGRVGVAGEEK